MIMKSKDEIAKEWIAIGDDEAREKEYLKSLSDEEFAEMCKLDTVAQVKIHWKKVRES